MLEHLVEDLGRLELAAQLARAPARTTGSKTSVEPAVRDDLLVLALHVRARPGTRRGR